MPTDRLRLSALVPLAAVLLATVAPGCSEGAGPGGPAQAVLASGDVVTVTRVVKGDEIVVHKGGAEAELRLIGVLSFSSVMPKKEVLAMAERSAAFLRQHLVGRQVTVQLGTPPKDVYGRYLAWIEVAGVDINRRLLERGLALVYTEFPFAREQDYLAAEREARDAGTDLWGNATLVKLAKGLRRQWADARQAATGSALADPLLAAPAP